MYITEKDFSQVHNEENLKDFIKNEKNEKGCKMIRQDDGILMAEFKTKSRDPKVPPRVYIEAVSAVEQMMYFMNRRELMEVYRNAINRLKSN